MAGQALTGMSAFDVQHNQTSHVGNVGTNRKENAMKTRLLAILMLAMFCISAAGCEGDFGSDSLRVQTNVPFIYQGGDIVADEGPGYDFRSQYPGASSFDVRLGTRYTLPVPPGTVCVLVEPAEFRAQRYRLMELEQIQQMQAQRSSSSESWADYTRAQNEANNDMQERQRRSQQDLFRQMDRTVDSFKGPAGAIDWAEQERCRQLQQNQRR